MSKTKIISADERTLTRIQEIIMKVGVDIIKKGEGALFVISDKCQYKRLLKQKIEPFSVFEKGAKKILLTIGMIDGAVIISRDGTVVAYGAMIKSKKVFPGYGTRHSAAYSASMFPDSIAILISQEEKKIKVFREGKVVIQVDTTEKNVKHNISEISQILESAGFGTISSVGVTAAATAGLIPFGISILPGILLFGVPYYVIKKIRQKNIMVGVSGNHFKMSKRDIIKKKKL